jgi:hypothetical protein
MKRTLGHRKFNRLENIHRGATESRNNNNNSHCQHQGAREVAALGEEYQSQTKAKHGPQNKIFPAHS